MKKKIQLRASKFYQNLTPEMKTEICNGCGSKGGISFPNTFYGLDMSEPCKIHDCDYYEGQTWEEKVIADDNFEFNLNQIIDTVEWLDVFDDLRKIRAKEYVFAVRQWGDKAFVAEKNIKPKSVLV